MYGGSRVVCAILARGGSKGVKKKNVRPLMGKPLIRHSTDVASQTRYIDQTLVSTDDAEIKAVAAESGARVIDRPAELASDTASYLDAMQHLLRSAGVAPDTIVVALEATSPIRTVSDVERCIELLGEPYDCVISVAEVSVHPAAMYRLQGEELAKFDESLEIGNRQDMEKLYAYTGSIFVGRASFLLGQKASVLGGRIRGYILDERGSVDINTPLDFEICEFIMGTGA